MGKGRKLTTSRSEVFLGTNYQNIVNVEDSQELAEDDVWSMVDGMTVTNDHGWASRAVHVRQDYRNPAPLGDRTFSGLSSAFEHAPAKVVSSPRLVSQFPTGNSFASPRGRHVATSAPVNVPDWSKIYRVDSVESIHDSDDVQDDQDFDMDMVIPPHEYLARSRDSGAKSVFVGSGRTLKGRDMSRVRDAVWSKTGFNG
uniref:uncharacterized protein LOC122598037 n=1 Tax=Erigeron canadensis TaxID=72917 RepID=UPI001CB8D889|nr:uncharacterized protein LOC122598037 [Erigeron canadensis]